MKEQIRHLVLRYGVFALLALMTSGVLFFECSFELRVKMPVRLFYDSHERSWHGYIASLKSSEIKPRDTLVVVQTPMGDVPFVVENITPESGMLHIKFLPVSKDTLPVTYCEGFVYMGKEKIVDKILNRGLR